MLWNIIFFDCWTWKKKNPGNRAWDGCFSWNLQFLSLNPNFRSQILAIALPAMYLITRNILRFFPQLMNPQNASGDGKKHVVITSAQPRVICHYLTLLNYNTSTEFLEIVKRQNFSSNSIIYKFQVWERETKFKCHKCDNIVKKVLGDFHVVADKFGGMKLIWMTMWVLRLW